jgi:hypothetical protein
VAYVEPEEQPAAQIAAVQKKEPRQKKKLLWKKSGGQLLGISGKQGASGSGGLTHSEQAQVGSGICHYHWTHGSWANKCEAPCSWTGS